MLISSFLFSFRDSASSDFVLLSLLLGVLVAVEVVGTEMEVAVIVAVTVLVVFNESSIGLDSILS